MKHSPFSADATEADAAIDIDASPTQESGALTTELRPDAEPELPLDTAPPASVVPEEMVEVDAVVVHPQTLVVEVAVEDSEHPTPTAEVQMPVDIQEPVQAVELGTNKSEAPIESDPAALAPADEAEVNIVLVGDEHTTENLLEDEADQPVVGNVSEKVDGTDEAEHAPIEAPVSTQEEDIQIQIEPPAPAQEVVDLAEAIHPAVMESNEIDSTGDAVKSESVDGRIAESEALLANGHSTPSEADVTDAPLDSVPSTPQPTPLLSLEALGEEVAHPAPSSAASEPEVPTIEGDITEAEPPEEATEPTDAMQESKLAAPVDVELTQATEPTDTPLVVPEGAGPVPAAEERAPAIDSESAEPVALVVEAEASVPVPVPVPSDELDVINTPPAADPVIVEAQILGDALELPIEVLENEPAPSAEAESPELAPAELEIDGSTVDVGAVPVESEVEPEEVTGEASESVIEEAESAVPLGKSKLDHNSQPIEDVENVHLRSSTPPAQPVLAAPTEETVEVAFEPEDAVIPRAALGEDQPVLEPVMSSIETSLAPVALVEAESSQVSVTPVIFSIILCFERYLVIATIGTRHPSVRRNAFR